ncbi:hypothetical protein LTR99_006592 [Exophiala xenobiotica]|uniref:Uncharacterized protein n=1 Tax=Vermiconidia calcicola TaxID=1690605 RepID=A0AAV9Q7X2_9PEZI|nr:hypothetical protein LTR92_008005 [Exophiala xenobiotica]KAK5528508.1 hypothetical protein LTR23_011012 [Chaetothyriales sp. CCFEE 6169]KAK5537762.1 hypothetical protein LTR25_005014 [Vermiconidia calcicola]KAK5267404.1 hypothetical protein LTR96_007437 [Exophiala xenobiotica]KAK5301625.1 hypothetical protein LTR99_006592 [Exophiala xenobiotica]
MAHAQFPFGSPAGLKRQQPDYGYEAEGEPKRYCAWPVESHRNFDFTGIPADGVLGGQSSSHGSDEWRYLPQHNPNSTYPYHFSGPHFLMDWAPQPGWSLTLPTEFVSSQEWGTFYSDQGQGVQTSHPVLSSSTVQLHAEPSFNTVPEYNSRDLPLSLAEEINVGDFWTERNDDTTNDQLPWVAEIPEPFNPYANSASTWQLNDNHATNIEFRRTESQKSPSIASSLAAPASDASTGMGVNALGFLHDGDEAAYDVCLGVFKIEVKALSSFTGSKYGLMCPVNLQTFGDQLKIYFQDTGKYAGLISVPALTRIHSDFKVKLTAHLVATNDKPGKTSGKGGRTGSISRECQVRVVVHGFKKEAVTIGALLSDAELFFQQPSMEECGRDIEYCNPHYLLRPGAYMPTMEDLSISPQSDLTPSGEALQEAEKSKFMRKFEDAGNPGDTVACYPTTPSPPALQSRLKE